MAWFLPGRLLELNDLVFLHELHSVVLPILRSRKTTDDLLAWYGRFFQEIQQQFDGDCRLHDIWVSYGFCMVFICFYIVTMWIYKVSKWVSLHGNLNVAIDSMAHNRLVGSWRGHSMTPQGEENGWLKRINIDVHRFNPACRQSFIPHDPLVI